MWTNCDWIPGAEPSTSLGMFLQCALWNVVGWFW